MTEKELEPLITEKVSRLIFITESLELFVERSESRAQVDLLVIDQVKRLIKENKEIIEWIGGWIRNGYK